MTYLFPGDQILVFSQRTHRYSGEAEFLKKNILRSILTFLSSLKSPFRNLFDYIYYYIHSISLSHIPSFVEEYLHLPTPGLLILKDCGD